MPIKILIHPSAVETKVVGAWDKQLYALSSQILGDCNQYVKVDHHILEASSYAHSKLDKGLLIWQTPYARRQYWEIKTSLTPGRTWKWCETAKRKCREAWQRIAQKGMNDNL